MALLLRRRTLAVRAESAFTSSVMSLKSVWVFRSMVLSLPKIRGDEGRRVAASFSSAGEIVFIDCTRLRYRLRQYIL